MATIHNELRNYQTIPRELIFDSSLSDRARFVFCYMVSKPDDWQFFLEPMANEIGYSVDTLRKYIKELVESGWIVKGEQEREKGVFGATSYTLRATKKPCAENTDTEIFRHGKNPTQHNIDIIQKREDKKKRHEYTEDFEEAYVAYRRKGSKANAYKMWVKLTDEEKVMVATHIPHYVSTREVQYQKDFERYLRDRIFESVVYFKDSVVFDPYAVPTPTESKDTICINGQIYR
jgi:hypothetical protein